MNTHHHVIINSKDRINYNTSSPSNFTVNLPKNLHIEKKCVELSYVLCPLTFYNITTNNNIFNINSVNLAIPPGNYDLNQLFTAISNLLEGGITLTYDDILNKVTITNTVAPFTLNFTGNNTVAAVLGFEKKIYSSANTQVSTFGPKIYNLMLYFTIEDIPTTYLTTIGNYSFAVPCNVNKLELLQYYAKSQTSVILNLKDNNLKTLNIRVYTEDGFIAQGLSEWCFAIKLL